MDINVNFHYIEIDSIQYNTSSIIPTLSKISTDFGFFITEINYIFCTDDYLLKINQDYLNHDYYTDIITFDNSEEERQIESDIFISIDRVKENAQSLSLLFEEELTRIICHGLLHLVGFKDKTESEQKEMRKNEDTYLSLWNESNS